MERTEIVELVEFLSHPRADVQAEAVRLGSKQVLYLKRGNRRVLRCIDADLTLGEIVESRIRSGVIFYVLWLRTTQAHREPKVHERLHVIIPVRTVLSRSYDLVKLDFLIGQKERFFHLFDLAHELKSDGRERSVTG